MPFSYAQYPGNGSTTNFSVPFPYLLKTHVKVYINLVIETGTYSAVLAEGTGFSWTSSTQIQTAVAPANGQTLTVRRETPNGSQVVQWNNGSNLTAEDLSIADLQNLYVVQEWVDYATRSNEVSQNAIAQALAAVATANAALQRSGGTMTGPIVLAGNPAQPLNPATKQYTDAADAALQADINTRWNKSSDTIDSTETWVSADDKIATTQSADKQFSTIVQPATPSGSNWPVGKTWLQNDVNKTLSFWNGLTWLGVASGGTFTTQPTVIYVDSINGDDANDGHRIISPKKTIKNAVQSASAGDTIKCAPGVYQEILPIDITVDNLSIVGEAQRSCFVHPTPATETQVMFRCNSGTYIDGFTFAGLKATGARGGNAIDNDATYGLPANQGWVAGFYPGCSIKKSPYINNCSNFADSGIDNSNFNPNNYGGTGGDLTSAPAGGGVIVDGSLPSVSSPLRSFVVNEFTQVCLDGPGLLVCNNGYAQAVSFFALFCHYHAKALSGGQINMEVGTTNFGQYGLIADGKSSSAIFTATANGAASASAITFAINAPTASGSWFGDANRPAINMLVQIGSDIYPILNSTVNGSGWNVTISRPNPSNRAQNLGLINSHANGATVSFFLRSMISTASHTMEYAGSGTNYNALPENGGVADESKEAINLNNGKVWLTSTDQNGKFKVGDTFAVDQQTGFVTIDPNSYSTNLVSDLSPELGGNLDVLTRNIYSSVGNVVINDTTQHPLGAAATPSITFTGNLSTGFWSPSADTLAASTAGSERTRIDSSGNLLIGKTTTTANGGVLQVSNGITFPATAVACTDVNTLDDYEEGTFTPTIIGTGTAGTATYAVQNARYTKTGRMVSIELLLNWSAGTGAGNLRISGLPFTSGSTVTTPSVSLSLCSDIAMTAGHVLTARVADNSTQIEFLSYPTGGGAYAIVAYDAAGVVGVSGSYSI